MLRIEIEPTTLPGKLQLIVGRLGSLSDQDLLDSGQFTSLVGSLEKALAALERQDATGAIRAMTGFVRQLQVLANRGDLSSAEADPLVIGANAIIAGL